MTGLVKLVLKTVAVAAPVAGALFAIKKLDLVNKSQTEEVDRLIEESDSNLETTLGIMSENNDEILKSALVGVEGKRKGQIKNAFEQVVESETYNTQLRFMNYNMWHNERIARNQAYQMVCILSVAYLASILSLVLFK